MSSLSSSYSELKPPKGFTVNYFPSVRKNQLSKFTNFGRNRKGGFTSTTFGSDEYKAFWTVKGDDPNEDVFECGSFHRGRQPNAGENDPNMVFTHHSIWFRGYAPNDNEARFRFLNNIGNK